MSGVRVYERKIILILSNINIKLNLSKETNISINWY